MIKRGLQVVLTLLVLGALGAATAYGISSALGIRVEPKEVPAEVLRAAPPRPSVAPPRVRVTAPDGVRLDAARAELRDATADGEGTATLRVGFGDGDPDDDSYRLTGTADRLRIRAASETGAVRGVYDLAQAAWAHRPLTERLGETVTSRLPFRMVDLGAAGVDPDPEQWRGGTDYSHYSRAFEDVLLPEAPWIDEAALASAREDLRDFASTCWRRATTPSPCPASWSTSPSPRCPRSTPTTRSTSPGPRPCGTRSARCGPSSTSWASTSTSAPTCSC